MKKMKILLIEDNRFQRKVISALLKKQSDVTATVANSTNILELIQKLKPNIVLLSYSLQSKNCLEVVKSIKKQFQEIKIILTDVVPLQADVLEFVQVGISGFTLKDIGVTEFLKTIRSVYGGIKVVPSNLVSALFSQIIGQTIKEFSPSVIRMTKREQQVVALIIAGSTNKEIAQKLHLSTYTVKSHVHNILEKLSLHTRAQIAKHANISDESEIRAIETTSLLD
jgi:two-component system response regulator DegU